MESAEISRQEYTARINRVMDYIGKNLDKPLDLNALSEVASFSPYHFHRIFAYIVGETPNSFVSRIRLERAAQLLFNNASTPIIEIAFKCGFFNISSFSRSFKNHFGMTAKEFRQQEKAIYVKDGIRYSKNCKPVSKIGKTTQHIKPELCSVKFNHLIIMDTKIEVKQMPELRLIYCRHAGAFNEIGQAYEKLFKWAGPRGLVLPTTKTVTVYHDDPNITSINKVRQDASITVETEVKVEGEIGKFTVPAGKYAVGHFEISETEFEQAWNTMCSWLTESGYQPRNECTYELYHNNHNDHPERKFIVDICIPIKPL